MTIRMRLLCAAAVATLAVAAGAGPVLAVDYWVDGVDGNDANDGLSRATAWKTIGKANATVAPGDTVHILEGVYRQGIDAPAGTSDTNRVVFVAEGRVVLDRVGITLRPWQTMDGINVERASIIADPSPTGAILRRCQVIRSFGSAFAFRSLNNVLVDRCVFAENAGAGMTMLDMTNVIGSGGNIIRHSTIVGNGGPGIQINSFGSGNRVENSIIAFNAGGGINLSGSNVSDFNSVFGNGGFGGYTGGITAGPNDLAVDPKLISRASNIFHLQPSSPLIGQASDGTSIGAYGVGFLSSNTADAWAGWTDDADAAVGSPTSKVFFDSAGHLRLREDVTVAAVRSPVISTNLTGSGLVSINFEATVFTDLPSGSRQVVDFDPTTRESEVRYRVAQTEAGIASAPFQTAVRSEPIQVAAKFIQVEYTIRRDGQ